MQEENNYLECLCSNCGGQFMYNDAIEKERIIYGQVHNDKVCPLCGSGHYTPTAHIDWLDKIANDNYVKLIGV